MDLAQKIRKNYVKAYNEGYGQGYFKSLDLFDTFFDQLNSQNKLQSKEDFKVLVEEVFRIIDQKEIPEAYSLSPPENASKNLTIAIEKVNEKMNKSFMFGYEQGRYVLSDLYNAVFNRFYLRKNGWKRAVKRQIRKLIYNYDELEITEH